MMSQRSVGIIATGFSTPNKIVTNHDIQAMGIETTHDWIVSRTGIHERRIAEPFEQTSDFGAKAGQQALDRAGLAPADIDLLIVATSTPDFKHFPSVACLIQEKLGLGQIGAFDVSAACTGFSYALTTGAQYIMTGQSKKALIIGADCLSKIVDWSDRGTCILFGDGAGAVILSEVSEGGLLYSKLYSAGKYGDILCVKEKYIHMQGRDVFKVAIENVIPAIKEALDAVNLTPDQISWFIPHQANERIMEHIAEKLGISKEKTISNIALYGNTSGASIPLVMAQEDAKGRFSKGDVIVSVGFGAGFTWGVNIFRWV